MSKILRGDRCRCSPLTGCGEYFNSTYAFDFHRTGRHGVNRRCLSAAEMIEKGMVQKPDGFWISSESRIGRGYARGETANGDREGTGQGGAVDKPMAAR